MVASSGHVSKWETPQSPAPLWPHEPPAQASLRCGSVGLHGDFQPLGPTQPGSRSGFGGSRGGGGSSQRNHPQKHRENRSPCPELRSPFSAERENHGRVRCPSGWQAGVMALASAAPGALRSGWRWAPLSAGPTPQDGSDNAPSSLFVLSATTRRPRRLCCQRALNSLRIRLHAQAAGPRQPK